MLNLCLLYMRVTPPPPLFLVHSIQGGVKTVRSTEKVGTQYTKKSVISYAENVPYESNNFLFPLNINGVLENAQDCSFYSHNKWYLKFMLYHAVINICEILQ